MLSKLFNVFVMMTMVSICSPVYSAVKINKASSVSSTPKTAGATMGSTASSLLPTVVGLVSNVKALTTQQDAITAECVPTRTEINFIDKMIKEWAKAGGVLSDSFAKKACKGSNSYEKSVKNSGMIAGLEEDVCYDNYSSTSDVGKIWHEYPKVGMGFYCKGGDSYCSETDKDAIRTTNAYELFALVDFGPEDYLDSEISMASKLQEKTLACMPSRMNAKKRELWGELLVNTVGGLGQATNTGSIMEQVSSFGSGGSTFNSIGSIATQFLVK